MKIILGLFRLEPQILLELGMIISLRSQRKWRHSDKKLSQEFSKTEGLILGTLFRLDEFLEEPQARVHSGLVPDRSWNLSRENQGMNEDRFQIDPQNELEVSMSRSSQDLGPEETFFI